MRSGPASLAMLLLLGAGCGGAQHTTEVQHTGWTVHYAVRVGNGPSDPREVRPDVTLAILDGRAQVSTGENEDHVVGRIDAVAQRAATCDGARCTPAGYASTLLALSDAGPVSPSPGTTETEPTVEPIVHTVPIADLPTQGARFREVLHTPGGDLEVRVEAHWIEQPGDPSVRLAADFFTALPGQLGAARLVERVRQTIGLPLLWEARTVRAQPDGTTAESAIVFRAAHLGNPPAAVPLP